MRKDAKQQRQLLRTLDNDALEQVTGGGGGTIGGEKKPYYKTELNDASGDDAHPGLSTGMRS
jgi:hypothetical protein